MNSAIVNSPFLAEVQAAFRGLLERGALTIKWSTYDKEAFGNAEVVLGGHSLLVRLVRDRGDVFADARPAGASDDWRPLERVLCAVGAESIHAEGLLSLVEAARLINEHLDALNIGLSSEEIAKTRRILEKLDEEATKRAEQRWERPG